jgi:TetR/AcrR family transcriptional repressor of nem operon
LLLAADWLQQRGYHGFSFAQIANALDIQSGAVHYHFPAKQDLVAAIFKRYRETAVAWCDEHSSKHGDAGACVRAFLEWQASFLDAEQVCPLGVAGVEYASLPSKACAEAESLRDEMIAWLTTTLSAGRDDGAVDFAGSAADQAALIVSATSGALQLARLNGSDDFRSVIRAVLAGLQTRGT